MIKQVELPQRKIKIRNARNLFDKYQNVDGKDTVLMSKHNLLN